MRVKVLREHNNGFGDKFIKEKDAEYTIPKASAQTLIAHGLIEEIEEEAEPEGKADGQKPSAKTSGQKSTGSAAKTDGPVK